MNAAEHTILCGAIKASGKNIRISLHIQANAKVPGLTGFHDGRLKLKVSARPVEGAANQEILQILCDVLNIPKSRMKILVGQLSKTKTVEVEGMPLEEALTLVLAHLK
jgi:uncharacterized protein (TIGR00251 family)